MTGKAARGARHRSPVSVLCGETCTVPLAAVAIVIGCPHVSHGIVKLVLGDSSGTRGVYSRGCSTPNYDIQCPSGHDAEVFTAITDVSCPCPTCGASTERVWRTAPAVNGDACDFVDPHLEQRFTSKAEHDRALKARGLVRKVRHAPLPGTDRSRFTTRWDTCPAALLISEAERIAQWHAWDVAQGIVILPRDQVELIAPPRFSASEQDALTVIAEREGL